MNFSLACLATLGNYPVEIAMVTQEQVNCKSLPYLEHDEAIAVKLVLAFLLFKCKELNQSVSVVLVWEEQIHLLLCSCHIFMPSIQHWLLPRRGIHFQLPEDTQLPCHNRLSSQNISTISHRSSLSTINRAECTTNCKFFSCHRNCFVTKPARSSQYSQKLAK